MRSIAGPARAHPRNAPRQELCLALAASLFFALPAAPARAQDGTAAAVADAATPVTVSATTPTQPLPGTGAAGQPTAAAGSSSPGADVPSAATPGDPLPRPRVALVLAGGSAFGLAHIGVIRVLEELGIPVDLVVGTSMGAVVGGFYALGHDAAGLEAIAKSADWNDLLTDSGPRDAARWSETSDRSRYVASVNFDKSGFWTQGGMISGNRVVRFLDSLTLDAGRDADFDAFPRRFRAVATDVATGERKAFGSGSLPDAIRASMSIPGAFSPWEIGGRWYVDGGAVDNLPIDVARELGAEYVIAVDLLDGSALQGETFARAPVPTIARSFEYLLGATSRWQYPNADLVLAVDLAGLSRTAFDRVDDFVLRGEEAARADIPRFEALRGKILGDTGNTMDGNAEPGNTGTGGKPVDGGATTRATGIRAAPPRAIAGFLVEGVNGGDKTFIEKTAHRIAREIAREIAVEKPGDGGFPPMEGPNRERFLEELSEALDRSGRFERIRYASVPEGEKVTLRILAIPRERNENRVRIDFLYQATVSSSITGELDVIPGLRYANLTTPGSRLEVDAELVDAPGADIRFVQPVGSALSVIPYYRYSHDFETRLTGDSIGYQYQTTLSTAGLTLALEALPGTALTAGVSCDWLSGVDLPGTEASASPGRTLMARAGFFVNTLDYPAFPTNGALLGFRAASSVPLGADDPPFHTLTSNGYTFLSLDTPFTVSFLWKVGTDFSAFPGGTGPAPPFYAPDLADRRLFPGPLQVSERLGSNVAGAGLELKHNLNWGSKGITVPLFLLMHGAAGATIRDPANIDWGEDAFHWNLAAGFGARLGDSFGAEIRGGVQRSRDGTYLPFLAIDLGAIGKLPGL